MKHNAKTTSRSPRVLVVDDDPRLVAAVDIRLSEIGCRCTACNNASEAMVKFAAGTFDLVITDLSMPGLDGLSVVATIRSQSDVPIVIVTGHSAEYGSLMNGYGNVTVLAKPLDMNALIACVQANPGGMTDLQIQPAYAGRQSASVIGNGDGG
jgi:DNA-binding response OmpR family regulator